MPSRHKRSPRRAKSAPAAGRRDVSAAISAVALLAAVAAPGLVIDTGADAPFDAPKRLATLLAVAVAALAAFGFSRWQNPFPQDFASRFSYGSAAALLLFAACGGALIAAFSSPRQRLALDSTRTLLLYALLLPLGASRVLEARKTLLLTAFLSVVAVNVVVSALQAGNIYQPFPLVTQGSRDATGAFVGNPGYLAAAIALAAVASLGVALLAGRLALRVAAGTATALFVGGLLINRNLTSLTALIAGAGILLLYRFGRRAGPILAVVLLLLAAGVLAYRPMRERAAETVSALRRRDWDRLITYRFGGWGAAIEMTRERPWTGFGPGTYGAEFVPHRLKAEIAVRRRLVNPLATSSYGEAHCDYVQPFAEAGIPAGLAVLLAVVLLLRGLVAAARRLPREGAGTEAIFLLAFLAAGAVAALTWFPMQRPISSVPLLLAAGRAWRISTLPAQALPRRSGLAPSRERRGRSRGVSGAPAGPEEQP